MGDNINVGKIVRQYLRDNGYVGLIQEFEGSKYKCVCRIDQAICGHDDCELCKPLKELPEWFKQNGIGVNNGQ